MVGCGGDADDGLGGGTGGKGGGDERDGDGDRDGDRLSWWEDNAENVTVGTEPNDPLAYNQGL